MRRIILGLLFATVWSWGAAAETRLALVIGNEAYRPEVGVLSEPYADADRVAAALTDLGFQVTPVRDATWIELRKAIVDFATKVQQSGPDTISVVYYSGHGAAGGPDADTYLIPTDALELSTTSLPSYGYKLDTLLETLESTSAKAHVVLIDACRNVPVKGVKGGHKGVASVAPRRGMLIGFSAEHGTTAEDAPHYSTALAAALTQPGMDLGVAMRNVRFAVEQKTGRKQSPVVLDKLSAPLYLSGVRTTPPADPCAIAGVPSGYRCVVQGGRAVLEATGSQQMAGGSVSRPVAAPAPPPSSPPGAYGISGSSWLRGVPGAAGSVFREGSGMPEMVVVPSGSFMMGSPATEAGHDDDEGPQRRIDIRRPFALGRYEVTFAEWDACASAGYCRAVPSGNYGDQGWGRGSRPVITVSWDDAQKFVDWLNSRVSGSPYRLPSEAEWEYAARAGTSTAYPWGSTASHEWANYGKDECCGGLASGRDQWEYTAPVGSFVSNQFGLHDMHGNVYEWVADCYGSDLSSVPADASAYSQQSCSLRVLRGGSWIRSGSWSDFPGSLRSADRGRVDPGFRSFAAGFRLARTLTP